LNFNTKHPTGPRPQIILVPFAIMENAYTKLYYMPLMIAYANLFDVDGGEWKLILGLPSFLI
jgi:hypothetical protein